MTQKLFFWKATKYIGVFLLNGKREKAIEGVEKKSLLTRFFRTQQVSSPISVKSQARCPVNEKRFFSQKTNARNLNKPIRPFPFFRRREKSERLVHPIIFRSSFFSREIAMHLILENSNSGTEMGRQEIIRKRSIALNSCSTTNFPDIQDQRKSVVLIRIQGKIGGIFLMSCPTKIEICPLGQ